MLVDFLLFLRSHRVPVSTREFMDLLEAMQRSLIPCRIDDFYYLSRMVLVKDEKLYDRFDLAFAEYFRGLDGFDGLLVGEQADQALREVLLSLDPQIARLPDQFEQVLAAYREQQDRLRMPGKEDDNSFANDPVEPGSPGEDGHPAGDDESRAHGGDGENRGSADSGQDGDSQEKGENGESGESGEDGEDGEEGDQGERGAGDDGKSGEGYSETGENGVKARQAPLANRRASAVWEQRMYADYDEAVELGTRNLKLALRRLRKFARTGAQLELDLPATISSTARSGGLLDIRMTPERHNAIKVLLFFDVGGSMDDHIRLSEQLFSAARAEFKHLEYFYFHNFIYETVWADNARRSEKRIKTQDILRKYGRDYKVIFVGDAHMARHEIAEPGGSVEHYNAEPGEAWLARILDAFRSVVWINPVPESKWQDSYTTVMTRRLVQNQMYPLSPAGLESAMRYLVR